MTVVIVTCHFEVRKTKSVTLLSVGDSPVLYCHMRPLLRLFSLLLSQTSHQSTYTNFQLHITTSARLLTDYLISFPSTNY
jgi:hypothetical protein